MSSKSILLIVSFIIFCLSISYAQVTPVYIVGNVDTTELINNDFTGYTLLPFTTGGNVLWSVDTSSTGIDGPFAHAGAITMGQVSWLETNLLINTPSSSKLSFAAKVTASHEDSLVLEINGHTIWNQHGIPDTNQPWNHYYFDLPDSNVTIKFTFHKESSATSAPFPVCLDNIKLTSYENQSIRIQDGTEKEGHILTSDPLGFGRWRNPAEVLKLGIDYPLYLISDEGLKFSMQGAIEGAPLILSNSHVNGAGLRINSPGGPGVYVDHPGSAGIISTGSGTFGFLSNFAGSDGFSAQNATHNGVNISAPGLNGISVNDAGMHGGNFSNAVLNGLSINNSGNYGLAIYNSNNHSIRINGSTANGIDISNIDSNAININAPAQDAISINQAGGHGISIIDPAIKGLYISKALNGGITIDSVGGEGIRVNASQSNAITIHGTGNDGISISNTVNDGISIISSQNRGILIQQPGDVGLRIDNSNMTGIELFGSLKHGVNIMSSGMDGIQISNSDDNGCSISGSGKSGVFVQGAAEHGILARNSLTSVRPAALFGHGNDANPNLDVLLEGSGRLGADGNLVLYIDYDNNSSSDLRTAFVNGNFNIVASIWEDGDADFVGNISKGGGSFKIDHPLDPYNKYLYHSFVESPDMMNIYNGTVTFDNSGIATVKLPEYFESLNIDFHYQLTCIGGYAPLFISKTIQNNQFEISGGHVGLSVSWQVTGVRNDPYAVQNRVIPEVPKREGDIGKLLHPEARQDSINVGRVDPLD